MNTENQKNEGRMNNRQGAAIGMVLIVLLTVALMGSALLNLSGTTAVEASKDLSRDQAFWLAEAGLEQAKTTARKNRDEHGDTLAFPLDKPRNWSGSMGQGAYQVDITDDGLSPPSFTVLSAGTSAGGIQQTVAITLLQTSAISIGIFGEQELSLKPNTSVYSYYSSSGITPTPGSSTGEASIGSNAEVDIQANTSFEVDGDIHLGSDPLEWETAEINCTGPGCGDYSDSLIETGHLDPDPLGLFGDPSNPLNLASDFQAAQSGINDNSSAPFISANQFLLGNGFTGTLHSGTYYLNRARIGNQGTLEIDASSGPVTIFLSGSMEASVGSRINLVGGNTSDFRIIANGSSPDQIWLQPNGDFQGFIYAPHMTVHLQPGGDIEGAVWAETTELWPGGQVYVDMDLMEYDAFSAYNLEWVNWRQMPN